MPDAPTKVALIGFGKVAREQHMPAIAGNPSFDLVGVADPVGSSADLPFFPNLAAMLNDGLRVDAVSICTPPAMRTGIAQEALKSGCHVLLEKPPAAVPSQLVALADLARRSSRGLYASWHSRETSCVDLAQEWLVDRRIDQVEIFWREDIRKWHPGQNWLLARGGLGVFDPGINAIAILTEVLPCSVWAESAEMLVPANCGSPIAATATLRCATGGHVSADFNFLHDGPEQWDIFIAAEGHHLELRDCGRRLIIDGVEQEAAKEEKYGRIYRRFAGVVAARKVEADVVPLSLVTDIMVIADISPVAPFEF